MTDIQGNYGLNSHYVKSDTDKRCSCASNSSCETSKKGEEKKDLDLDKNPAAVAGRSMVNHKTYKPNPNAVSNDVEVFNENFALATDFAAELIEAGYSPEKAASAAAELIASCIDNGII